MVQWGWIWSEMWAEDAEDTAEVASSTVTCSLGENVDWVGQETWEVQEGKEDQASPDGTRWEAGLQELDTESYMMLGQDCCHLSCSFLIPTCNCLGQVPSQLFYRGRRQLS